MRKRDRRERGSGVAVGSEEPDYKFVAGVAFVSTLLGWMAVGLCWLPAAMGYGLVGSLAMAGSGGTLAIQGSLLSMVREMTLNTRQTAKLLAARLGRTE